MNVRADSAVGSSYPAFLDLMWYHKVMEKTGVKGYLVLRTISHSQVWDGDLVLKVPDRCD